MKHLLNTQDCRLLTETKDGRLALAQALHACDAGLQWVQKDKMTDYEALRSVQWLRDFILDQWDFALMATWANERIAQYQDLVYRLKELPPEQREEAILVATTQCAYELLTCLILPVDTARALNHWCAEKRRENSKFIPF